MCVKSKCYCGLEIKNFNKHWFLKQIPLQKDFI